VMPETYDELQGRYSLGGDPFDPHDNILAGTAYLREMYDIYGSPGFLAAYNAGPRRLDDYLSNNRALPDETRRYVAMIGPNIVGVYPTSRSPAEDYAMNTLPIDIPRGTRYGRATQVASSRGGGGRAPMRGPVEVAQLPEPPRQTTQSQPQQYALATPPSKQRGGFRLIQQAVAESIPMRHGGPPSAHRRSWRSRTPRCPACTRADAGSCIGRGGQDCRATPRCRRANAWRMAGRTAWCCRRSRSRSGHVWSVVMGFAVLNPSYALLRIWNRSARRMG
jgi:Transglycosylase SLT domain